ncbi:uncharacterized protein LOC126976529 isoform X2 [Leptidea sinapis]|nr:uncharacterized protein LOC126976529 isoform X2 [Leptidea sinapis]
MERCIAFIGDNAAECVKTNAFLNLPKEALIKLISSDFLCLEEEEVWRCALAWAKQRAGVTQPTAHWAEEERARVCHHLAPLMHHIRLLLIDSTIFAEEVEPTGAVPMELSLERYRRAALHARPDPRPEPRPEPRSDPRPDARNDQDKRTQPRLAVNMFPGSLILTQDKSAFQSVINTWVGSPRQSWRLVFRASTHGFSAQAFHSHCDNVAPVLLLVQLSRGEVLGGYCEVGWSQSNTVGGYIPAEHAFLFTMEPPALHTLTKRPFALCYHPDCGPIFGAGADLLLASECNSNADSYSNLHSYGAPDVPALPASLAPDYAFTVRDYELYTTAA